MIALGRPSEETQAGGEPDGWIRESYSRILASCVCAGLAPSEAEDIAQDIWLWLLQQPKTVPMSSKPWLGAVARNFIFRYRRRKYLHYAREGRPLDEAPEPRAPEALPKLETSELLDRVAAAAPDLEQRMLALIRGGYTLAESARLLGIPRGSRAYHHGRLVAFARHELGWTSNVPIRRPIRPPA
jgi:DNA-directed RNA polymerase specialized sigma24 family protein